MPKKKVAKKRPKKAAPKLDFAQNALRVVQQAIGGLLAPKDKP